MKKLFVLFAILSTLTVAAQRKKSQTSTTTVIVPSYTFAETDFSPRVSVNTLDWGWFLSFQFASLSNVRWYQIYELKCSDCTYEYTPSQIFQVGSDVYQAKLTPSNTLITSTNVLITNVTFTKGNKSTVNYRIAYGYGDGKTYFSKLYTIAP